LIRIARISHGISFERVDKPGKAIDLGQLIPSALAEENRDDQNLTENEIRDVVAKAIRSSNASTDDDPLKWSEQHFLVLKIKYPATDEHDTTEGYLIYMKSTMTGDEQLELRQFKKFEPQFPHNPTADQFYDPVRFDAYVELGYHIANQIGPLGDTSDPRQLCPSDFIDWMAGTEESTASNRPRTKRKKT
jgi:hypothetical protein